MATKLIFNEDCVNGAKKYLASDSIDCIITDPPYGIDAHTFDKHYNRDESNVVPGYVEWSLEDYLPNTLAWLNEAARVLKPNGTMYIVSGWSRLYEIMHAIRMINATHTAVDSNGHPLTERKGKPILAEVNHVIWKYNFGVYTTRKFVTSHYHILVLRKIPLAKQAAAYPVVFNNPPKERQSILTAIQKQLEKAAGKILPETKSQYRDMEDVWIIPREYRHGETKNVNQLPTELVRKMIAYSTNPGDIVCDFFLGGFTVARVAKEMGRVPAGFEMNKNAYDAFAPILEKNNGLK